jgi:hypothetical protein
MQKEKMGQKLMFTMSPRYWIMPAVIILFIIGGAGCKSKKKAMEADRMAVEKAKIEQEAELKRQRDEEELRVREAEEQARQDEARTEKVKAPAAKLDQYFNAIANSSNTASANSSINEALTLCASPSTLVLSVISEIDGQKDYDRPTTIREYLNYVKDQRRNINRISNLQFDSSGKITGIELTKIK